MRRVFAALAPAFLLAAPAYAVDPPLVAAAKAGNAKTVYRLLAKGADPNVLDDEKLMTALNWAAYKGEITIVHVLLDKGAAIDARSKDGGWTPLMNAAARGHHEVVAYLIKHGADINARSADGGDTPLMFAAFKSHPKVVKILVEAGARLNDVDDQHYTALMFADHQKDASIGAFLSAHGALRVPRPEKGSLSP